MTAKHQKNVKRSLYPELSIWSISPALGMKKDILQIFACTNEWHIKQGLSSLDQIQMIMHIIAVQTGKYRYFSIWKKKKKPQKSLQSERWFSMYRENKFKV